jgi:hypothetical protein
MTGWILFALHIILDVAIIWYVREMLIRFNIISQGYETIMNLLRHSIDTKEYLEEYRTLFSLEDERDLEDAED